MGHHPFPEHIRMVRKPFSGPHHIIAVQSICKRFGMHRLLVGMHVQDHDIGFFVRLE